MKLKKSIKSIRRTLFALAVGLSSFYAMAEFKPPSQSSDTGNLAGQMDKVIGYFGNFIYVVFALATLSGVVAAYSGITGWLKETRKGEQGVADYSKHGAKMIAAVVLLGFSFWISVLYETSVGTQEQKIQKQSSF